MRLAIAAAALVCAGCAGGAGTPAEHSPSGSSPVGQTRSFSFMSGSTYMCWESQDLTQLWCWGSAAGLTASPSLTYETPAGHYIETLMPRDQAICLVEDANGSEECILGNAASPAVATVQTMPCTVLTSDSFSQCYDGRGYSSYIYMFPGVTLQ